MQTIWIYSLKFNCCQVLRDWENYCARYFVEMDGWAEGFCLLQYFQFVQTIFVSSCQEGSE